MWTHVWHLCANSSVPHHHVHKKHYTWVHMYKAFDTLGHRVTMYVVYAYTICVHTRVTCILGVVMETIACPTNAYLQTDAVLRCCSIHICCHSYSLGYVCMCMYVWMCIWVCALLLPTSAARQQPRAEPAEARLLACVFARGHHGIAIRSKLEDELRLNVYSAACLHYLCKCTTHVIAVVMESFCTLCVRLTSVSQGTLNQ
jgi:hypothetical protein